MLADDFSEMRGGQSMTPLALGGSPVTLALQVLEAKGLIRTRRGTVLIVDRQGLVDLSDGLYGLAELEYRSLFA